MIARVSTYHGSPDHIDDAIRFLENNEDWASGQSGFLKSYLLVDRKTGKAMTITLWDSEASVQTSVGVANPIRQRINESLGATSPPQVEVFEVGLEG
jgi:heme-degrading monooxygenase HmoA